MMKLARYSVSGTIHRNGIDAMFCVMWLVTARRSHVPIAGSASHSTRSMSLGVVESWSLGVVESWRRSLLPGSTTPGLQDRALKATAGQRSTKTTYAIDQICAWRVVLIHGSMANGYAVSAASDARFDSANRR